MIIKELSASFGGLINRQLQLKEGLNIIQAPNESGKSTWCGFIRAMLYGINTSERDKIGTLSEKTKYRPWSGASMEGRMEVEVDGRDIAIQRTNLGQIPMKKLSVLYSKTGQEVLELANESIGETLTGVPEKVFERSAFIRQTGIQVTQTGELEQRISSLVSSGEEGISYSETDSTLRGWLRKRRHNKSGSIPKLEQELTEAEDTLESLEEANLNFGRISLDVERVTLRRDEMAEELEVHEELERRTQREQIQQAQKKVRDLERETSYLQSSLTRDDTEISREMVAQARENYDKLSAMTVDYTGAKDAKESALTELDLIEEERVTSIFEGIPIDAAKEIVSSAAAQSREVENTKHYKVQKYSVPISILSVIALAALVFSFLLDLPLYIVTALAAAGAVALALMLQKKKTTAHGADIKWQETLSNYKSGSLDDMTAHLEDYERLCSKSDELNEKFQQASATAESTFAQMQQYKDAFEACVHSFAPEIQGLEEAFKAMSSTEQLSERLAAARIELDSARNLFNGLSQRYEGDWAQPVPRDGLKAPIRGKMETSFDLKRLEKELGELKTAYAAAGGELRALGDPVVLGARAKAIGDRIDDSSLQYDALAMAVEALDEANREIQARFSPKLGKKAGEYLDKLTDGRYKRLVLDKDLNPQAEEAGASVSRDILYLSGGTVDQIYLALRLAICEMVLPEENLCPIILDDVLVYFDDARLESALALLKEISQRRQVILFTCHDREGKYFSDGGANVLPMDNSAGV